MRRIFFGPGGLRAGWRFLAFLAIGEGLARPVAWLITHPLGYTFHAGYDPWDFIVEGGGAFAIAVCVAAIFARFERQTLSDYGLPLGKAFGRRFWEGMLWGFGTSAVVVAILGLAGAATIRGLALHGRALIESAVLWLVAFVFVGLSEEFLYRGYPLKALSRGIGFWPASLLTSALFGGVHLLKPNESFLDIFNIVAFGVFWCLTLRRTGSLWFAIGFHGMSDYTDMIVFAEPNTGNAGQPLPGHLLDVTLHGPSWLTGGVCGTEASVVALAVLLATAVIFHFGYPRVRNTDANPTA